MPHIIVMTLLGCWALLVLRDRPRKQYAAIYFVAGLIGFVAEFAMSGIFQFYHLRTHLLADRFLDVRLAAVFDKLGSIPLIAVIYARYASDRFLTATVGGVIGVGLLEVLFLQIGAIEYRSWHPLLTMLFFGGFYMLIYTIVTGRLKIPRWLHLDAFAFWAAFLVDVLFHGALWLFHYEVPLLGDPKGDSRLFAFLFNGFLVAPLATVVGLQRRWNPLILAPIAAAALLVLEVFWLWTGLVVYDGWNLVLAAARYGLAIGLPLLYGRWLTAKRKVTEWNPPE